MNVDWIECSSGQMPEDDEQYKGKKVINVLVTTDVGTVTKVQRIHSENGRWYWGRIYSKVIAWLPLPAPYKKR